MFLITYSKYRRCSGYSGTIYSAIVINVALKILIKFSEKVCLSFRIMFVMSVGGLTEKWISTIFECKNECYKQLIVERQIFRIARVRSLVVSDLRLETKGSRFESGCQLCAEVSSLQQSPG